MSSDRFHPFHLTRPYLGVREPPVPFPMIIHTHVYNFSRRRAPRTNEECECSSPLLEACSSTARSRMRFRAHVCMRACMCVCVFVCVRASWCACQCWFTESKWVRGSRRLVGKNSGPLLAYPFPPVSAALTVSPPPNRDPPATLLHVPLSRLSPPSGDSQPLSPSPPAPSLPPASSFLRPPPLLLPSFSLPFRYSTPGKLARRRKTHSS